MILRALFPRGPPGRGPRNRQDPEGLPRL